MLLFFLAVVAGGSVGLVRGGRIAALAELRFRAHSLLVAGLVAQLALEVGWPPAPWRAPLLVGSYLLVGAWLACNTSGRPSSLRLGLGVIAAGWALNLLPVAVNGAMPVSSAALAGAGFTAEADVAEIPLAKRKEADARTDLAWLGDVVPVPLLAVVVSLGDLVMIVGIAVVVSAAMCAPAFVAQDREREAVAG